MLCKILLPDEKLQEWLVYLNTEPGPSREIIQALSIQYIQMRRYVGRLNRWNTILTIILIALAVIAILVSADIV